ncbi:hypothetical protein HY629_02875 [Candidatus Uhrbacteria bacterium]|nr:hypothetical protein [Candidatus Uhrbacteria bacterium]
MGAETACPTHLLFDYPTPADAYTHAQACGKCQYILDAFQEPSRYPMRVVDAVDLEIPEVADTAIVFAVRVTRPLWAIASADVFDGVAIATRRKDGRIEVAVRHIASEVGVKVAAAAHDGVPLWVYLRPRGTERILRLHPAVSTKETQGRTFASLFFWLPEGVMDRSAQQTTPPDA